MQTKPPLRCIYCGAVNVPLIREHIVPYSLGGTWTVDSASCNACAKLTSRFERSVSRDTYIVVRTKNRFPTYHPQKRPKSFPAIVHFEGGMVQKLDIAADQYPTLYPRLRLPPPGILSNAPPSDTSPEMIIELAGNQAEIDQLLTSIPQAQAIELQTTISWESLCRSIAKIAHSYLVANFGYIGYTPLLPSLILGGYPYISHLVGGITVLKETEPVVSRETDGVALSIDPEGLITIQVDILGGRLPSYSAVAGKITDWNQFMTNCVHTLREGEDLYDHPIKTRFGFNHDWAMALCSALEAEAKRQPALSDYWPLVRGYSFDAYAIPPRHVLLILEDRKGDVDAGPDGQKLTSQENFPSLHSEQFSSAEWRGWLELHLGLREDQWPIIVPTCDSGKSNVDLDYKLFSTEDKNLWEIQWRDIIESHRLYATEKSRLAAIEGNADN